MEKGIADFLLPWRKLEVSPGKIKILGASGQILIRLKRIAITC